MTKSKMAELFKRLDDEKVSLFQHGVDFDFTVHDQDHDTFMHTGIGSGENMCKMALYNLCGLYKFGAQKGVTIEEFAESVKSSLIRAYKEDIFGITLINEEAADDRSENQNI